VCCKNRQGRPSIDGDLGSAHRRSDGTSCRSIEGDDTFDGGSGSLVGSFVGSFVVGVLYNFGQALLPDLAYVVLFLPMLVVLVVRPSGLFGRSSP
jgi:hypothetical protein